MTKKYQKNWYETVEVAEMYGVTVRTVARWIKDGFLPGAEKKGPTKTSPYRIPKSAIEHFDRLRQTS